ncbi:universal stress protein [Streptomyces sp. NPDC003077]|uniref:universal stress protein n=1 Tax=Streptomyces sp. NPDC003077 TaxID=3154443 RepID=UPI0033B013A0
MPGTITVGLDGSPQALAAADWAAAEAARTGKELRLVHAWLWQPLDIPLALDTDVREKWARNVLNEGRARLAKTFPDLPVGTELVVREPVDALLAEAAEADLLVLGSRGHGTLTGYLLGSVALHVLRQATRPVVMVRDPRPADAERRLDEVVVGVEDTGETGAPVLEFAFAAAAARGATLRAVRAWSIPSVVTWSLGSLWLADEAGGLAPLNQKLLADALAPWREKYPAVKVIEDVEMGSATEVLLSHGGAAALLVVGRRERGVSPRRIGSVAHAALHHAPGAVAVVPHP